MFDYLAMAYKDSDLIALVCADTNVWILVLKLTLVEEL